MALDIRPGGEEHRRGEGGQVSEPGEGDVGHVVRLGVVVVLVHEVGHQDQDVDGGHPAHGEHRRHGDEVVLRALLLGQVQIVVRVLRVDRSAVA